MVDGDNTEEIPGGIIQHGKSSDRIYLMKLDPAADVGGVLARLDALAAANDYGKIFAKAQAPREPEFLAAGYRREGLVAGMYNGCVDGVFMCKYPRQSRMDNPRVAEIAAVLTVANSKRGLGLPEGGPPFAIRGAAPDDAAALAALYRRVFASYPFPIFDPEYLIETMASHVVYFLATDDKGDIVAAASAEMDKDAANAEMTDFATAPECRGKGIAVHLLAAMEAAAPTLGIKTAFTIARALSHGMNATFARLGYQFGGTLVNNTQISGRLESMNVWHKAI